MENAKKSNNKMQFDLHKLLLLFAIIPTLVTGIALCVILVNKSGAELKDSNHDSFVSVAEEIGVGFDYSIDNSETMLKNFTMAPIVKELLLNPDDPEIAKAAEQYTLDFYGQLEGWEGIYIASWDSKVLTHPAEPVIGKVMREGDALKSLQDSMLASDGVYNAGIIESPASGQLIISMYAPVYDGDKPIGYVGGGTFVNDVATKFMDVSSLGLSSAYVYFVDGTGIMLSHPDESKIGNQVENEAVKGLVVEIGEGKHPEPECVEYLYKGKMKYAAYYIGKNEHYIAILTCDEDDVMFGVKQMLNSGIITLIVVFIILGVVSVVLAKKFSMPLHKVADALDEVSKGSLEADTDINANLYETKTIVHSAKTLQDVLKDTIYTTKSISTELKNSAITVDETANESDRGLNQIASAMEDLAGGATLLATNVQDINADVLAIGNAIDDIIVNTNELTESSEKINITNNDAQMNIARVADSSVKSVESIKNISLQIKETNDSVGKIQDAVDLIASIASQTNLLALNASIEAARAGEAGKGFAVVATEIKNLSEQSNNSTTEIRNLVQEIVDKSSVSVQLSADVENTIKEEQSYIAETQDKFKVLNTEIVGSLKQIEEIGTKIQALNDAKVNITSAVSDLSAVSEENAASNQEVSASIIQIRSSIKEIVDESGSTKDKAINLDETVSYFS